VRSSGDDENVAVELGNSTARGSSYYIQFILIFDAALILANCFLFKVAIGG